jgi:hypothetical protein
MLTTGKKGKSGLLPPLRLGYVALLLYPSIPTGVAD